MPPLGMALLVVTKGDVGLPLGTPACAGTGDARFGGEVVPPFAVARGFKSVLVVWMLTCVTVMSALVGETTRPARAVPVALMDGRLLEVILLSMVSGTVDLEDTDIARYSVPQRRTT